MKPGDEGLRVEVNEARRHARRDAAPLCHRERLDRALGVQVRVERASGASSVGRRVAAATLAPVNIACDAGGGC